MYNLLTIVSVLLLVLLILVAILLACRRAAGGPAATPGRMLGGALGGALGVLAPVSSRTRAHRVGGEGSRELSHASTRPHAPHPLGLALMRHAHSLGPTDRVGTHPLDRDRYEPLSRNTSLEPTALRAGPGALGGAKGPRPKKPWTSYETWAALQKDAGATAAYFAERARVLNNPDLDWGPVLAVMGPKLQDNREYIGLVNLGADGRTLRLEAHEASPVETGSLKSETTFAAVPAELVAKYASRPALFLFHTHPADPRGSPLPSSQDLSVSVYFAAMARFAAHAVISRYGVLVFGLDWDGYKAIGEAKDWTLALLNLSHDVVVAHEAVRSWSTYTLQDYLGFYPRHRLLMFAWPTSEMIGDGRRFKYQWDLETPIDHEVIQEHSREIEKHVSEKKLKSKPARELGLSLGLD